MWGGDWIALGLKEKSNLNFGQEFNVELFFTKQ